MLDATPGEEAGLKSATFRVRGDNAYGVLGAERGVHRLVRLSPFDSAHRRQTSFAQVDVAPELPPDAAIEIDESDLRIDTYRSSGAGGQHVNKTDSAVRITHLPTGIVVQCQNERSQHANKDTAMRVLKSRLLEREEEARQAELARERGTLRDNAFGSQIRSYVLHPYTMVNDHRSGLKDGNAQGVLDGDLDPFISAYLLGAAAGTLGDGASTRRRDRVATARGAGRGRPDAPCYPGAVPDRAGQGTSCRASYTDTPPVAAGAAGRATRGARRTHAMLKRDDIELEHADAGNGNGATRTLSRGERLALLADEDERAPRVKPSRAARR